MDRKTRRALKKKIKEMKISAHYYSSIGRYSDALILMRAVDYYEGLLKAGETLDIFKANTVKAGD